MSRLTGAMPSIDPGSVWTAAYLVPALMMWALMMVAMMLPSAAPMILLYGRLARRAGGRALDDTLVFALSYVVIWTLFSAFAALGQAFLIDAGAISRLTLRVGSGRIAGGLFVLVGLYQLSPLKKACLDHCRSPLSFVMRLWRPGPGGALRLGLVHGLYCLGCCWGLMLLLFVGGAMSTAWIAGLAAIVFLEKVTPLPLRPVIGGILVGGGAIVLAAATFR